MKTEYFSPHHLQDFSQLQTLFSGEHELKNYAPTPIQKETLYFNRWKVALILITAPLRIITALFLEAIGYLTFALCLEKLSRPVFTLSSFVMRDLEVLTTQLDFGKNLIIPAGHFHALGTRDVYGRDPIEREKIPSKEIRDKLFSHPDFDTLTFYHTNGMCRGGCYWFNFLFLKALQTMTFEEAALFAAKQFEYGMPRQAALIQTMGGIGPHILNLEAFDTLVFEKEDLSLLSPFIERLPDGIYLVGLHDHCISYLKAGKKSYLWDYNKGLIRAEHPAMVIERIGPYLKERSDRLFFRKHSLFSQKDINEAAG